jgi:hypothetical protein
MQPGCPDVHDSADVPPLSTEAHRFELKAFSPDGVESAAFEVQSVKIVPHR